MKAAWTFRDPRELRQTFAPSAPVEKEALAGAVGTSHRGTRPRAHPKPVVAVQGSPTSEAAARALQGSVRQKLAEVVYWAIWQAGWEGLTDEQGIEATGIPASTYRPRRVELREANRVYDSGRTRLTKSRRAAVVWVAR